jgi:hypothetical protein
MDSTKAKLIIIMSSIEKKLVFENSFLKAERLDEV